MNGNNPGREFTDEIDSRSELVYRGLIGIPSADIEVNVSMGLSRNSFCKRSVHGFKSGVIAIFQ